MDLTSRELPKGWALRKIRDVYEFTKKPRGFEIPSGSFLPFLPMDTIPIGRTHISVFEDRSAETLTSGTYVEDGDLLVAKITPSFENGKQVILDWKRPFGFATTEVIPIKEIKGISDKYFLFHFLLHPDVRADLTGKMDGTTGRQRLSKEVLGDCMIPVPPLDQQRKIAAALGLVRQAMEEQEGLILLTSNLKKSLLHKLFTEGTRGEPLKQTEIGFLPQSWQIVELIDAVEQIDYGISAPIPKAAPPDSVKIVSTADISKDGRVLYKKIRRIAAPEKLVKRLTLRTGDVLFNWRNSAELVGKTAVFEEQEELHVFASFILRIRCGETKIHNYYLAHLMNYFRAKEVFLNLARRAVNQANYNRNEISVLKIPLPSIGEQKEIAESIAVVDEKIAVCRMKHERLTDLCHSLLNGLITGQVEVDDLNMPELGSAVAA